jgi:hypothetical protein
VINGLLARKVESVGHMASAIAWSIMLVINGLLARKVESVGHTDSTTAGSMNARS